MNQIKKVQGFECSDGEFFNAESDAKAHQKEINFKEQLEVLIRDNVPYANMQETVIDFIKSNRRTLFRLLSKVYE